MSVCGQTEDDSASEEVGPLPVRDIYKPKAVSKVVRVLTVLAYLFSVSLAAILLSVYYICVWKSPDLPAVNSTDVVMSAQRSDSYYGVLMRSDRGSNITVKEMIPEPTNMTTSPANTTESSDSDLNYMTTDISDTTSHDIFTNESREDLDSSNITENT